MAKGANLVMTVIWCVLMLWCLFLVSAMGSLLFGILALFCIYRAFFRIFVIARVQYRRLAQLNGGENWVRRIAFEEDGIILTEGDSSYHVAYSEIVNIREKGNKIWLDAANKTVLRLYKDAFVESDWEECRQHLDLFR